MNECGWARLRQLLMDLLGERRRLVPLLDPVLLSDLQARVRAHSLPPTNVFASGQRFVVEFEGSAGCFSRYRNELGSGY